MTLLSDLVRVVSEVEGLDETSVGIFARAAREAGLISQGGRGRSAARMTTRDAANLLIAVNASALAKNVPDVIASSRKLKAFSYFSEFRTRLERFERLNALSFGASLELLIEWSRQEDNGTVPLNALLAEPFSESDHDLIARHPELGALEAHLTISFFSPSGSALIQITGNNLSEAWVAFGSPRTGSKADRSDITVITQRTLLATATLLGPNSGSGSSV